MLVFNARVLEVNVQTKPTTGCTHPKTLTTVKAPSQLLSLKILSSEFVYHYKFEQLKTNGLPLFLLYMARRKYVNHVRTKFWGNGCFS